MAVAIIRIGTLFRNGSEFVSQNVPLNSEGRRRVSVTQPSLGYRLACGLEKHTRDEPAVFPGNPEFVDDRAQHLLDNFVAAVGRPR